MTEFKSEANIELILTLIKDKVDLEDLESLPTFKLLFNNYVEDIDKMNIPLMDKNKLLIVRSNNFFENLIPRYGAAGLCKAPQKNTEPSKSKEENKLFEYRSRQAHETPISKKKKKKEEIKHSLCVFPTEIKANKLIFEKKFGLIKNIYISKLFVPNIINISQNFLGQKKYWHLDEEPFITYSICVNSTIDLKNKLFMRKSLVSNIVHFETDEKMVINDKIETIVLTLTDKYDQPINIPTKYKIINIVNGSTLKKTKGLHKNFFNKQIFYIFSTKILKPDDKIIIDNYKTNIVGTCKMKDNCIEDTNHDNREIHNCNIINMKPDFKPKSYYFQDVSNAPMLYFSIVLS